MSGEGSWQQLPSLEKAMKTWRHETAQRLTCFATARPLDWVIATGMKPIEIHLFLQHVLSFCHTCTLKPSPSQGFMVHKALTGSDRHGITGTRTAAFCVCESGVVQADPPRFIWVQKHINHCHRLPNSFVSRYTYVTYVILKGAGLLLFLHQFLDSDRSSRSRDLNHEILWNLPIHSMTYFSEDMWTPFFLASLSSLSLVLAVLSPVLGVVLSFRGKPRILHQHRFMRNQWRQVLQTNAGGRDITDIPVVAILNHLILGEWSMISP